MGIPARSQGFRFTEEEYGMIDALKAKFWMLFDSRKAVLSFALRVLWSAVFTDVTLRDCLQHLQVVLCASRESAQMCLRFPPHKDAPRLKLRFGKEAA